MSHSINSLSKSFSKDSLHMNGNRNKVISIDDLLRPNQERRFAKKLLHSTQESDIEEEAYRNTDPNLWVKDGNSKLITIKNVNLDQKDKDLGSFVLIDREKSAVTQRPLRKFVNEE